MKAQVQHDAQPHRNHQGADRAMAGDPLCSQHREIRMSIDLNVGGPSAA
jgi:hypothetical protein